MAYVVIILKSLKCWLSPFYILISLKVLPTEGHGHTQLSATKVEFKTSFKFQIHLDTFMERLMVLDLVICRI